MGSFGLRKRLGLIGLALGVVGAAAGCQAAAVPGPAAADATRGGSTATAAPAATPRPVLTRPAWGATALAAPTFVDAGDLLPTDTPGPTSLPTATFPPPATLTAGQEARKLLRVLPYDNCNGNYPECAGPFTLRILDYLRRNPQAPERLGLIEYLFDNASGRLAYDPEWLYAEWLEQTVVQPFQQAGGAPPGFAEAWSKRGEVWPVQFEGKDAEAYLVRLGAQPRLDTTAVKRLYYLSPRDGEWQLELLESTARAGIEIVSTDADLDGDGRADLAYSVRTCGASDCSDELHLLAAEADGWRSLPLLVPLHSYPHSTNGGWQVEMGPDGRSELVMMRGGPGSAGFGDVAPYRVHFAWQDGAFTPVRISPVPERRYDRADYLNQWADRLAGSGRIDEARQAMEQAAQRDRSAGDGSGLDYRPFTLFRLGLANLYLHQPGEALLAWLELAERFPDTQVGHDVQDLAVLVDQPDAAWQVCAWYHSGSVHDRPEWTPLAVRRSGRGLMWGEALSIYPDTWCQPVVLVNQAAWSADLPLAEQAEALGFAWRPLAETADLNGDGQSDPVGVLDGRLWAFLSGDSEYRPLYIESGLPPGAVLEPVVDWWEPDVERQFETADLDRDGLPEILVFEPGGFGMWRWSGRRFEPQWVQYLQGSQALDGRTRLEDGQVVARVAPAPYADERVIGEWTYRLVDGQMERVDPPVAADPVVAAGPGERLAAAVDALFRRGQPQEALDLLGGFTPRAPAGAAVPDFFSDSANDAAAACALRALAYETLGNWPAARRQWQYILEQYPETPWAGLAQERLSGSFDRR